MNDTATLPCDPRAEAAVCHYIGRYGSTALRKLAVVPDHFFDPVRAAVVTEWLLIAKEVGSIDLQTTSMRLRAKGKSKGGMVVSPAELTAVYLGAWDNQKGTDGMAELAMWKDYNEKPEEWVAMLERLRQLRVIVKATHKAAQRASTEDGEPCEIRAELRDELSKAETRRNESLTASVIEEVRAQIIEREVGGSVGLKTGIHAWDKSLHGIFPKRFYAIGARPKLGKSALIEQICTNQVFTCNAVLIFQRDMSVTDMVGRMACRSAGVVFEDFIAGAIESYQAKRIEKALADINPDLLRIYSPTNLTAQELAMIVERETEQFKVKAFYLDLFQRLKTGKDKVEGLVDAANTLREVIQNTGTPGIVLAEVTKESDKTGGRPHAGQFKYCDGLFSACDVAVMLWSNDDPKTLLAEKTGEMRRQKIYFTVDANRGGAVSDEVLFFDRPQMRFYASQDGGF